MAAEFARLADGEVLAALLPSVRKGYWISKALPKGIAAQPPLLDLRLSLSGEAATLVGGLDGKSDAFHTECGKAAPELGCPYPLITRRPCDAGQ